MSIVAELDRVRKERGLSQEEIAFKAGCDRRSISQWARGKNRPLFAAVEALANALGYDVVLVKRGE